MIRAKFSCSEVTKNGDSEQVTLHAIYSSDPNSENHVWAKYTPCGSLSLTIDNPAAQGKFERGKTYYLDISPSE